jgi:hypothetical protein
MLLIEPTEAAEAIGAKCGPSVAGDSSGIRTALRYITPAIESMLEVASLEARSNVDHFVYSASDMLAYSMVLTNAFVAPSTVLVTDPNGAVLTPEADFRVASLVGRVSLTLPAQLGEYRVLYVSGFEVAYPEESDEPLTEEHEAYLVAQGVPDWVKGMVITLLVEWLRSKQLSPKIPENVRLSDLMRALRSDLSRRMGNHYYRPRYGVVFPEVQ